MANIQRYAHHNIDDRLLKTFIDHPNRMAILFQWTKDGTVSFKQFQTLIKINEEEHQYQIDLDTHN